MQEQHHLMNLWLNLTIPPQSPSKQEPSQRPTILGMTFPLQTVIHDEQV
jgi:hypothetical protein